MPVRGGWESSFAILPTRLDDSGKYVWWKPIERLECWTTYGGDLVEYYMYRQEGNKTYMGEYPVQAKVVDPLDIFFRIVAFVMCVIVGYFIYMVW